MAEFDGSEEGVHVDVENVAARVVGAEALGPGIAPDLAATHVTILPTMSGHHPLLPGLECQSLRSGPGSVDSISGATDVTDSPGGTKSAYGDCRKPLG